MKVATCGTFDVLHEGHILFLKECTKWGELYVLIVPDSVATEKKHKLIFTEQERRSHILQLSFVKDAYIDCTEVGMQCLGVIKPDYFCFGYNQPLDGYAEFLHSKFPGVKILKLDTEYDGVCSSGLRKKYKDDKKVLLKYVRECIKNQNADYQKMSRNEFEKFGIETNSTNY